MIGGTSLVGIVGWIAPLGYGGRSWFKGPQRTISVEEVAVGLVVGEQVEMQKV